MGIEAQYAPPAGAGGSPGLIRRLHPGVQAGEAVGGGTVALPRPIGHGDEINDQTPVIQPQLLFRRDMQAVIGAGEVVEETHPLIAREEAQVVGGVMDEVMVEGGGRMPILDPEAVIGVGGDVVIEAVEGAGGEVDDTARRLVRFGSVQRVENAQMQAAQVGDMLTVDSTADGGRGQDDAGAIEIRAAARVGGLRGGGEGEEGGGQE